MFSGDRERMHWEQMGFFELQEEVGKQNNLDRQNKLIILVPEIVVTLVAF